MTRYVVLLRTRAPLGGICPVCECAMDESGCRIGDHVVGTSPSGISQVVEVLCAGTPTLPITECPVCHEGLEA
jgi:hypothetical protein